MITQADIDNTLRDNPFEQDIRHSLSNYFNDLEKPVSVAIGIAPKQENSTENDFSFRDFQPSHIHDVVNLLREKGIDAVSFLDPQAKDPAKFVVNSNGVSFPFMSPEDALKATVLVETIVRKEGYNLVGHATPLFSQSLLYTGNSLEFSNNEHVIDVQKTNPNKDLLTSIENKYGNSTSFIDRKLDEAYGASHVVDFAELDNKNVYEDGGEFLFRGGCLGANPYAVISEFNSRKVAHSSPAPSICASFSGKGHSFSSRGGAVYKPSSDGIEYGFIYKFKSLGDQQKYYCNVGIETANNPNSIDKALSNAEGIDTPWNGINGTIYETPILPHHNKLESLFIYVGKNQDDKRLFEIPLDENGMVADPEWRDFLDMHEPSDDKVIGYLAQRQNAQKKEQTLDDMHSYKFELQDVLEPDNQEYLTNVSSKEFIANFVNNSKINDNGTDKVEVNNSIDLSNLHLQNIPDLSNIKINGEFVLNEATTPEMDIRKLPETTKGIYYSGKLTHGNDITATSFLKMINAEEKNGFYDIDKVNLHLDEIPQGWSDYKFEHLPQNLHMAYDTIDQIPETRFGIGGAPIIIKNQDSVKNMPVEMFAHKILGNVGTSSTPPRADETLTMVSLNEYLPSINLSNTNISQFPRGFSEYKAERIVMNPEVAVTSLKNFPETKEGIYNLNFSGDLKEETMLSFLNKVKGKDWVQKNVSVSVENGAPHVVINGDLDFRSQGFDQKNENNIQITSLPKDFDNVEIKGRIYPDSVDNFVLLHKDIVSKKHYSSVNFPIEQQNSVELQDFECSNFSLSGDGEFKADFPQKLKSLAIINNNSLAISSTIPESCSSIGLNNVNMKKSLELPEHISSFSSKNSKLSGFEEFPSQTSNINLSSVEFTDAKKINFGACENISLSEVKFPENTVIDLSQCKSVVIKNIDLSKCNVIMPKDASSISIENAKFNNESTLDLSGCKVGELNKNIQSGEIILPQVAGSPIADLPKQVKEIPLSYLNTSKSIVGEIPDNIVLRDVPDKNGKNVSLKKLKHLGLQKNKIKEIRNQRIKQTILTHVEKVTNFVKKNILKLDKKTTNENGSVSDKKVSQTKSNNHIREIIQQKRGIISDKSHEVKKMNSPSKELSNTVGLLLKRNSDRSK